jgi:streptogramin lyase
VWLSGNGGEAFLPNPAGAWAARFDPSTGQWDLAGTGGLGQSGIVQDAADRMWINYWGDASSPGGLLSIDAESLQIGEQVPLPHTGKGVSVDKDGNVWSIAIGGVGVAMRYDPTTQAIDLYDGLTNPYTYSDMTGWALQNAWCEPEG